MTEETAAAYVLLLVGVLVVGSMILRALADRLKVPALVAFLALGLGVRVVSDATGLLPSQAMDVLSFLGTLGLALLLFRVGLESRLGALVQQLRGASPIWMGNIVVSGLVGYVAGRALGLDETASIVIGVALTATSVAVPAAVWTRSGRLESPEGQRFIDVAELDDLSGVVLMALLLGVLPVLASGGTPGVAELAATSAWVGVKLAAFLGLCALLYRFGEPHIGMLFTRLEPQPQPLLGVVGIALVIAAIGALLGFSVAIGAFFAGVVFSRDPQHIDDRTAFRGLFELLVPFFFIGVGVSLSPADLLAGLGLGVALTVAAIAGKLVGTIVPALLAGGAWAAIVLGVSMVPRAEITLVIAEQARAGGGELFPVEAYSALIVVVALTSIVGALALGPLLAARRGQPGSDRRAGG